jgi:hypothetical protein
LFSCFYELGFNVTIPNILLSVVSGMEMVVPEVNKELLAELEAMGFPTARATRALHFSGKQDGFYAEIMLDKMRSHAITVG